MILSNNHVLANCSSNAGGAEKAYKGDSILQPGKYDGGKDPADRIAKLERWIKINVFAANEVDCAVAIPLSENDVSPEILEIGRVKGVIEAQLGMKVQKSGRTTGLTKGEITDVNATIRVQYPGGYIVTFKDQILTGPILQGGDSGSWAVGDAGAPVLDAEGKLVGLGFAGSDQVAVFNKISKVLELLKVDPLISEPEPEPPSPDESQVKVTVRIFVEGVEKEVLVLSGKLIKVEQQVESQATA